MSAKMLGKQPAVHASPSSGHTAATQNPALHQVKQVEKRVTRSSTGGPASNSREVSVAASENLLPKPYLPTATPILLTVQAPPVLQFHAVQLLPADEALLNNAPASPAFWPPGVPEYRLLSQGELVGDAAAQSATTEFDTSDAFYHRLHRYPEILEKRSARLEKERLIHERNKLVIELEDLRGRGWVYQGSQGGKGEQDRRKKIRDMEDRLKRYDALLPNQPRKSNSLSSLAAVNSDNRKRSESPALPHSRSHSRHPTLGGKGGTMIKLSLAGSASGHHHNVPRRGGGKHKLPPRRRPVGYAEHDDDDDDDDDDDGDEHERYTGTATTSRRRRSSNTGRATYGSSSGTSLSATAAPKRRRPSSSTTLNYRRWQVVSDSGDDDDGESDPEDFKRKRVRLPDSFFTNAGLRDQYLASSRSRRSSSRLAYAFGQRLPDEVERQAEFELKGGVSGVRAEDDRPGFSSKTLEDMVVERDPAAAVAVWNGVVVPKSALEAVSNGPVVKVTSSMSREKAAELAAAAAAKAQAEATQGQP